MISPKRNINFNVTVNQPDYSEVDPDLLFRQPSKLLHSGVSTHNSVTSQRALSDAGLLLPFASRINRPKKEGMIDKWSPSFFKGWQSRWVSLDEGILKYYKIEKDGSRTCCGILNFDLYECTVSQNNQSKKD